MKVESKTGYAARNTIIKLYCIINIVSIVKGTRLVPYIFNTYV